MAKIWLQLCLDAAAGTACAGAYPTHRARMIEICMRHREHRGAHYAQVLVVKSPAAGPPAAAAALVVVVELHSVVGEAGPRGGGALDALGGTLLG